MDWFWAKDAFGRYKRRCLLACLGESARKLTILWLRLGGFDSSVPYSLILGLMVC